MNKLNVKFFITIVHVTSGAFRCLEIFLVNLQCKSTRWCITLELSFKGFPNMYTIFLSEVINKLWSWKCLNQSKHVICILYSDFCGLSVLSAEVLLSLSVAWQYFYKGVGKLFLTVSDSKYWYYRLCEPYTCMLQLLSLSESCHWQYR